MKRELDLIRLILLKVESNNDLQPFLQAEHFTFDGYHPELVKYNLMQLIEADYLKGEVERYLGGGMDFFVEGLTWAGHDFLDAARDDSRWNKAKPVFEKMGNYSLEFVRTVLSDLAVAAARSALGI